MARSDPTLRLGNVGRIERTAEQSCAIDARLGCRRRQPQGRGKFFADRIGDGDAPGGTLTENIDASDDAGFVSFGAGGPHDRRGLERGPP